MYRRLSIGLADRSAAAGGGARGSVGNPASNKITTKERLDFSTAFLGEESTVLLVRGSVKNGVRMSCRRGRNLQSEDGYAMLIFPKCYERDS